MKILRCFPSVDPRGGGPAEVAAQVSSVHRSAGHEVEWASLDDPGADGLPEVPFPVAALGPGRGVYRYSPAFFRWVRANRDRFDAVVVHGLWQYTGFATRRALAGGSTPYYVYPHGMLDPWFKRTYPLKHIKKWLYWPWGEYRVLRDAAGVIFTCEEERRLARESFWLYHCNEHVLSYGTAAPPAGEEAQRSAFLRHWPEMAGKRVLLFLGRIHVKKGLSNLLQAFAQVRAEAAGPESAGGPTPMEDVRLVLAGPCADPGYLGRLREEAEALGLTGVVLWSGMLSGGEKWGAFRVAEAFILPSHQENFGVAVVEAMACCTPVLISDQVNIWREVAADGAGLVEPDTVEGTALLIRRWLREVPSDWARRGRAGRALFERRFEVARVADQLIDLIADPEGEVKR